jgi:hypothetical protein
MANFAYDQEPREGGGSQLLQPPAPLSRAPLPSVRLQPLSRLSQLISVHLEALAVHNQRPIFVVLLL